MSDYVFYGGLALVVVAFVIACLCWQHQWFKHRQYKELYEAWHREAERQKDKMHYVCLRVGQDAAAAAAQWEARNEQ